MIQWGLRAGDLAILNATVRVVLGTISLVVLLAKIVVGVIKPRRLYSILHLILQRRFLVRLYSAILLPIVAEILNVIIVLLSTGLNRLLILEFRFPRLCSLTFLLEQLLAALLVQLCGLAAVHLEPPIANQLRLLEDGAIWTEERYLPTVVTDMEHLERIIVVLYCFLLMVLLDELRELHSFLIIYEESSFNF